MNKWHKRFLDLAWHISTWSKDPSTQVGAVVVDNKKRIVSVGFNGFPAGVDDTFINRDHKLLRTVHAEVNAVTFTHRSVEGCSIYITHPPCAHCAAILIQHGVVKVMARRTRMAAVASRGEPYYLQADGKLAPEKPSGSAADGATATSFTFDPRDPVPTIGGNISSGNDIMLQGAWDQRGGSHVWNFLKPIPLSARNDVLVFQTEPLAKDLEVTGELEVRLWISSTAVDTDFTAKLIDVYPASAELPGGFDLNIADGIVRARFRDSLKDEKLMEPGRLYPITVRLYPTSNVFKKGHRIRVDFSSSNFPRFDVNPNTGEPLARPAAANGGEHDLACRGSWVAAPRC